jgi:predicted PurR-regulated permease PerM
VSIGALGTLMAKKQQELEVVVPVEEPEEMPLPSDPKVIFLGGLFALALLTAIYVAAEIVLPLVLALVLNFLLQPAMRLLERWHLPRMLAALLLILLVFGTIVGLGATIAGPASTWADKLPEGIPRLQERLNFMQAPINTFQRFLQQVEALGQPAGAPAAVSAEGSTLMTKLFTGTRYFASGFFTTILFLSSCSCQVTRSCAASSRYCQASAISVRPSTSSNRSKATSLRIL